MPAYDYRCTACETRFEVSRSMGSTDDVCCPDCERVAKRLFTPVGVSFKGTGFHNTDYRPRPKEDAGSSSDACPARKDDSSACSTCPATD